MEVWKGLPINITVIFEPTCAYARWARMHRFSSVCLCLWLDQNYWTVIHISGTIWSWPEGWRLQDQGQSSQGSLASSASKQRQVGLHQRQVAFFRWCIEIYVENIPKKMRSYVKVLRICATLAGFAKLSAFDYLASSVGPFVCTTSCTSFHLLRINCWMDSSYNASCVLKTYVVLLFSLHLFGLLCVKDGSVNGAAY